MTGDRTQGWRVTTGGTVGGRGGGIAGALPGEPRRMWPSAEAGSVEPWLQHRRAIVRPFTGLGFVVCAARLLFP